MCVKQEIYTYILTMIQSISMLQNKLYCFSNKIKVCICYMITHKGLRKIPKLKKSLQDIKKD